MLVAAAMTVSPAATGAPVVKTGKTWHKAVCPKSPGAQVMRCHALVVTDSKGHPIKTPPQSLPNGKQPDR